MQRVVFDTGAIVSAVLFRHGRLAWLRQHWRERECIALVSRATAEEISRVLAYRKLRLTKGEYREALAAYLPYCDVTAVTRSSAVLCRDAKDQIFLDLAESGNADVLVSGDRDLLALAGRTSFAIESPEAYRQRVLGI